MKIRAYNKVDGNQITISIRKDEQHYRSKYSVCLISKACNIRTTTPNRATAKKEFIRLLRLYTNLSMQEILKLK
jgi:hypothetical protein